MKILSLRIQGQSIVWENPFDIVSGSQKYLYIKPGFGKDWDGLDVKFLFSDRNGNEVWNSVGNTTAEDGTEGLVRVPHSVICAPYFMVGVLGYGGNDEFIPTAQGKVDVIDDGYDAFEKVNGVSEEEKVRIAEVVLSEFKAVMDSYAAAMTGYGESVALWTAEEDRRQETEAYRREAEQGRVTQEEERRGNEAGRILAEDERKAKEGERETAEDTRTQNETERVSREAAREDAEKLRNQNENTRRLEEEERAAAESGRDNAEKLRQKAEVNRVSGENERITAEEDRKGSESLRIASENLRKENEILRMSQEEARTANEAARAERWGQLAGECATAKDAANAAAASANNAAGDALSAAGEAREAAGAMEEEVGKKADRVDLEALGLLVVDGKLCITYEEE